MPAADRTLQELLPEHLIARGLPADSGVSLRWVWVRVLGVPLGFPNFAARRVILVAHDVHHLLTGYATDWTGEGEIGGFEIASGCGRYWAAWMFNFGGLLIGLCIAPRRTWRGFVRGRRCTNFYGQPEPQLLLRTVDDARRELGLDRVPSPATVGDALAFVGWVLLAIAALGLLPAIAGLLWWCWL